MVHNRNNVYIVTKGCVYIGKKLHTLCCKGLFRCIISEIFEGSRELICMYYLVAISQKSGDLLVFGNCSIHHLNAIIQRCVVWDHAEQHAHFICCEDTENFAHSLEILFGL